MAENDVKFTLDEVDDVLRVVAAQGSVQRMDEPLMQGMRNSAMERLRFLARSRGGFTPHTGGPGIVGPATFSDNTAQ